MKYFLLPGFIAVALSTPFAADFSARFVSRNDSGAYEHYAVMAKATPRITAPELSALLAPNWRGTLTYLDYSSHKSVVLNTSLQALKSGSDRFILRFDYEEPNHTHVFGTDTLTVASGGTTLRWDGTDFAVKAKQWLPGQTLRMVLEGAGQDDNHAVIIRKTLLLNAQQFAVRKQVRLPADTALVQRNFYQFAR
ncbi:MAG: DoxX family protein [Hymenobacter sp.]|nr:DoxX family protein [Hymenobacter sp.]